MYYLPTYCLVFFFLFSLFYPLPCSSSKQELGWCEAKFQCGSITAGFPFWGGNLPDHCGHPWLKLHCNKNITSLFISKKEFSVFHLNQKSNTLTLARTELLSSFCSSVGLKTYLPPGLFELSPTYKSLTVFYPCISSTPNLSSYKCPEIGPITASENPKDHETCLQSFDVNVPMSFVPEEKELNITNLESVLRKGFDVKVKIDMKACQECSSSHGICSFNETLPYEFKCIQPHPPTVNELHRRCSGTFSCGDQREHFYPFWIPGREDCGLHDFRLNCSGGFAELSISSVKKRILAANYDSGIIRLARSDFINDLCPQDSSNTPPFDGYVLPFAPTTDLLTIYYDCHVDQSWSVSTYVKALDCGDDDRNFYVTRNLSSRLLQGSSALLNDFKGCSRNVSIPASRTALNTLETTPSTHNLKKALEDGFELGVNLDCRMCMESRGACGYNQTQATSGFVCYCIDEPHRHTCGSRRKDPGLSAGVKTGIAAGALLGLVMLILGICFLIRRRKKTSEDSRQQYLKALIPLKHYRYVQLEKITKSFAEVVGKGGFGTVYRGILVTVVVLL